MKELSFATLTFLGEEAGAHVHVTVLGAGQPGQRPLCGRFTVRYDEWQAIERTADAFAIAAKPIELVGSEVARLNRTIAELRAELAAFDPIRSVLADWEWSSIAHESDRLSPLRFAAEALVKVEGALGKMKGKIDG